jgi:hypothetical protein
MSLRGIAWSALMLLGAIVSAGVTLHGIYNALRVDFSQDSLLSSTYCLLPILCFPVFVLVRPASRAAFLLAVLACGFLVAYSALNWRTCAELGYCTSILATVLETLSTRQVLGFLAVAAISLIAEKVDDSGSSNVKAKS